jgi:hypothetical protein
MTSKVGVSEQAGPLDSLIHGENIGVEAVVELRRSRSDENGKGTPLQNSLLRPGHEEVAALEAALRGIEFPRPWTRLCADTPAPRTR